MTLLARSSKVALRPPTWKVTLNRSLSDERVTCASSSRRNHAQGPSFLIVVGVPATGGEKVTRLVYRATAALADGGAKPEFIVVKTGEKKREGPAPSYKVVMGLAPIYVSDGERGMGVDHVTPEGPAQQGGMKNGDRILRIGDDDVANIYMVNEGLPR